MNHPLATLCDQFLTERQFLKNVIAAELATPTKIAKLRVEPRTCWSHSSRSR